MIAIKGTGVSGGIAEGSIFCYKRVSTVAEKSSQPIPQKSLNAGKRRLRSLMHLLKKQEQRSVKKQQCFLKLTE